MRSPVVNGSEQAKENGSERAEENKDSTGPSSAFGPSNETDELRRSVRQKTTQQETSRLCLETWLKDRCHLKIGNSKIGGYYIYSTESNVRIRL